MKINSIYISAFGGIKNLKLDFNNGFNVILGDNENGKSTVMAFIKMMFYGSDRGSSQIAKNIRKKSAPWDGSQMAGSIDFEHSGKLYRIEREFKTSNSTDKVTLIDLDLGTRQTVTADIGSKFFGLSSGAFERSVFIGQFGFPESDNDAEGELNSRLSNIALTGQESVSFETVYKRVESAKLLLMSKSGRAGEYDKNIKAISELKARIERAVNSNKEYAEKINQAKAIMGEIELLKKNTDRLKEQIGAEQDIRNAEKIKRFLELSEELDALNETLKLNDGKILDEMFLRKLQFQISKTETAKNKADSKQNEIESFEKSISAGLNPPADATKENAAILEKEIERLEKERAEILLKKQELEQKAEEKNIFATSGKPYGVLLILAILGAVFAGGFAFMLKSLIPTGIMAVLSVAFLIGYIILIRACKKNVLKEKQYYENLNKEISNLAQNEKITGENIFANRVRLDAIKTALNSTAEVIKRQTEMLNEAKAELSKISQDYKAEEKILIELFGKYKEASFEEIKALIPEISDLVSKQKELKQQIGFISSDLGNLSREQAEEKLSSISADTELTKDFDEIKQRYEEMLSSINDKNAEAVKLMTEAKAVLATAENAEELRKQQELLTQKAEGQKEFCEAADIALSALADSFAEARRSYGSHLERKAASIFSRLTGGKYETMSISKAFDINVSETDAFGSRDIGYLSSGTADQAYLSLRLALSELISEKETLPILLDDALAQYDDSRMKTALEFLKEYSEKTQIIMFTCHNAISEAANANKIILAK